MNDPPLKSSPLPRVDWQRFSDIVMSLPTWVLTSHVRPDCDAIGSELGMAGVLESLGKKVRIVNGQATPPNLATIDPARRVEVLGEGVTAEAVREAAGLIVLDTSSWVQLGSMADVVRTFPGRKLLVDHHAGEDELGAEKFKDVTAEATGRLVVEAADALRVSLTPAMAKPLFAALATDTGWFRFGSTRPATFQLAARLVDAGASPAAMYADLYEQDTAGRVRLRGLILSRLVTELDGTLVHTYALAEDFVAMEALPSDTEDVVNQTLTVRGTEFAVIFVGIVAGGYKVSFRSRGAADCNRIAQRFGGGGHQAAAGALVEGDLDSVRDGVLAVVREVLQGFRR